MSQTYFAVITPGLEGALQAELRRLKARKCKVLRGGVEFEATNKVLYTIMHRSRLAHHVRLRLDEFRARDERELYRKVHRMDWARLLPEATPLHLSTFSGPDARNAAGPMVESISCGIRDAMVEAGKRPPALVEAQEGVEVLGVIARQEEDRCELSLSANATLLHKRGWRQRQEEAPLRETLACALLDLIGWTPGTPLIDPMCGSGTFIIEAARQVADLPPRQWDTYSFHHWHNFNAETWRGVIATPAAPVGEGAALLGFDRRERAVDSSQLNARAAEVAAHTRFAVREVAELEAIADAAPGVLITNAPFGMRVHRARGEDAPEVILMRRFAEIEGFAGWRLGVLVPEEFTVQHPALDARELAHFDLGGRGVRFWGLTRLADGGWGDNPS